jgi:voltage-gated potassium channel
MERTASESYTPRLAAYLQRTQGPLDLLALLTLWLVTVPPGTVAGQGGTGETVAFVARLSISAVYAVDLTIKTVLSGQGAAYLRTHPLGIVAVVIPPARVLFSLRLVASMFRRGNLLRFVMTAGLLMANAAIIVYFFERHHDGANITTVGQAFWWAIVTVATVGYGDLYPVTVSGRVVASLLMFLGILVIAVVTAQVASTFMDQAARRRAAERADASMSPDISDRLDRLERMLDAALKGDQPRGVDEPGT